MMCLIIVQVTTIIDYNLSNLSMKTGRVAIRIGMNITTDVKGDISRCDRIASQSSLTSKDTINVSFHVEFQLHHKTKNEYMLPVQQQ